jgi:peptide subunit release factor 1 (eRF1)
MPTLDQISAQLDRLAALEAGSVPVISLYLNMRPDQHGRDNFEPFLRKELAERVRTYEPDDPARVSLEADAVKIRSYLGNELDASANGLALFACSHAGLFEAVQLAAPIPDHRLYIAPQPHLYPLARLMDTYPRYAVLLADTNAARIFVFAANAVERTETIQGTKTKRHSMGGSSQARYQRHVENFHLHHAKEVVDALDAIVRTDDIKSVIVAGDEVIVPLLQEKFPTELAGRVVDVLKLNIRSSERDVIEASIEAMRRRNADTDRERVRELLDAYRASGLACVGVEHTRNAFELGQVDELVISATPEKIQPAGAASSGDGAAAAPSANELAAGDLVARARKTSAKIRFIEDASLLDSVGGVGAFLRFKI